MSDRTIPSAATILASENDFLRRENIRLREVINARFIKYSNMDSERDALAARLEIAEAERNDALRASMKDMARLAEVERDAERYRWLRSQPMRDGCDLVHVELMDWNEDGPTHVWYAYDADGLDAAIDAAMGEKP